MDNAFEKSKICFVTARNIFDAPCLEKYKRVIHEPFDILYWDKSGINENCGEAKQFVFRKIINNRTGKIQKALYYYLFSRFIIRVLKKQKYEKIIVFPTQTAWIISRFLKKHYKGKYILDIRDYAGEKAHFFYNKTKKVINNSGLCCITSPDYKAFLPKGNYIINHNTQNVKISKNCFQKKDIENDEIVIAFIGTVRFFDIQKQFINLLKNDKRFKIMYIGKGSEIISDYCKKEKITNVETVGFFNPNEIVSFYRKTDLVLNLYGNNNGFVKHALSNKLYSAASLKIPILVSPSTYMETIVSKYKIGFSVDLNDTFCADNIYKYYNALDFNSFSLNCELFLKDISIEEKTFADSVYNFFYGVDQ